MLKTLVAAALLSLVVTPPVPGVEKSPCTSDMQSLGVCPTAVVSGDGQVDLVGRMKTLGAKIAARSGTRPATYGGFGVMLDPIPHPNPDALPAVPGEIVPVDCTASDVACRANREAPTPSKGRVIPAVTVSDLVSFRPAAPGLSNEPDGVGVVGLPTNLLADTATQTLHGVLFDYPVAVRFTPDHYTFTYGDGNTTTTRSPGRAWATSGDPQFTPTTTSHAYRERGTFTATVTVSYAPAVDFGDGVWRPVPGYVTSTSAGQRIRVYEAHTALVAHTCTENPTGPGC